MWKKEPPIRIKTRRQGQTAAAPTTTMTRSTRTQGLIITWTQFVVVAAVAMLLNCLVCQAAGRAPPEPYYGRYIGQFSNFAHGIKGSIYAVDESTLFVKSFAYDGTGPDAFFWVGKTARPSPDGYIIPYPEEYMGIDPPILQAHNNTDIILRLPMGKRIKDIRWLSVWCRRFTVDFGEVFIPAGLDVPKPRVLPEFKRLAHGLRSSNISVLDAKTFYIPNLHYDGAGPDAYFWVGNGSEPNIMGIKVPNEIGSLEPLRGYQGEDIEIQLPGTLTVYNIDWLSVWCVEYRHNFGHVFIPKDLDVPPALGQTKITTTTTPRPVYSNCREVLPNKLQVKWELQGEYLQIELFGRISEDQYMAFGLSGANGRAQMAQSDVVVAFYDTTARVFRAEDYFISDLSQCDGQRGVCPDERIGGRNDVVVVSGDRKNGVTSIRYKRLLQTNEPIYDAAIPTDREVSIIAAIGPLNSRKEANAHSHTSSDHNPDDIRINFSTRNDHACKSSLYDVKDESGPKPWPTRKIEGVTKFRAVIGPTGGKRGYTPITGVPSWGIAWYLNDLLIPEITVERGKTYEFTIEGGSDPAQPARFHPFYITDSPEGGLGQKMGLDARKQKAYAGVEFDDDGDSIPTAAGRYCEWQHRGIDRSAESETFEDYKLTLELHCEEGEPGYLNWTVPMDAPDLLYYQCFTHNNLGWKINVVNSGASATGGQHWSSRHLVVYAISTVLSLVATRRGLASRLLA
ncbi:protein Skeletor, isoforms B/C isoform X2 [Scaptodrosophila lebanonensis]|uniref:Protein Skeletor, isoforms B/C isoform X2 n=1 Tax=Drosophila lebanonensis TaxID=7225 RepID=A0A6J2T421_DROLE|nr:protein Skeletor, isoforms B/C isoform X2 [Scaptodrosophila lebanonensis]